MISLSHMIAPFDFRFFRFFFPIYSREGHNIAAVALTHRHSPVTQNRIHNVNLSHLRPQKALNPLHESYFSNLAHTSRNAPTFTYGRNHLNSLFLFLLPIHPRESRSGDIAALTTTHSRMSQNTTCRSSLSRFRAEISPQPSPRQIFFQRNTHQELLRVSRAAAQTCPGTTRSREARASVNTERSNRS